MALDLYRVAHKTGTLFVRLKLHTPYLHEILTDFENYFTA